MNLYDYKDCFHDVQNEDVINEMDKRVHLWSNYACKGYCVTAMKNAGLDPEQMKKVLQGLRWAFDEKTIEEAEQIGIEY